MSCAGPYVPTEPIMKTSRALTTTRPTSSPEGTDARQSTAAQKLGDTGVISAAERHRRIAESAYLRAAARDFAGDQQLDDWLAAERKIDAETAAPGASHAPQTDCRR
jgi:hypothetical protein